jgi:SpoVK/Ycf46/Vps4 family AAA+-type ATPase
VFSTVNNPLNVDESIMTRSGRIDETIEVGYPDETLMTSIFKNYCDKQGYTIDDELSAYTVTALVKAEMSAADVENFCRQIYIKNGKKDGFIKEDLDSVIQSFAKSRDASSKNYYKRQERIEDQKKALGKL